MRWEYSVKEKERRRCGMGNERKKNRCGKGRCTKQRGYGLWDCRSGNSNLNIYESTTVHGIVFNLSLTLNGYTDCVQEYCCVLVSV